MRIAVIGTSGQLGFDLARVLPGRGHEVVGFSGRGELNIREGAAIEAMLEKVKPDAVINTAAFHNVDLCETEQEAAIRTNTTAVRLLAVACDDRGVILLHIGTDYVFGGPRADGTAYTQPIPESEPATPNSTYSSTRYGGDERVLFYAPRFGYVVRSCGLFGVAGCKLKGGLNFVDTMIKTAREGKALKVVDDQIVAPTPTDDLAVQLAVVLEKRPGAGLYHAVSHGACSWYEFAKAGLEMAGVKHEIAPVASSAYAAAAKRPAYSVLDNAKLRGAGLDVMREWREGLERFVRVKYPRG